MLAVDGSNAIWEIPYLFEFFCRFHPYICRWFRHYNRPQVFPYGIANFNYYFSNCAETKSVAKTHTSE
nr:unnamed protein product [Callosobruchus analis]